MKTSDIILLKDELVEDGAPRHRKYDMILAALGGDYQSRRMEGFWENWQQITGRSIPEDREKYEFRLNILPSIVRGQRAFLGTIPNLQVPPSSPVDPADDTLRVRAEKLERVYQGYWNYSSVGRRMNQIGYWNPTLGTSIGVIWPDIENKRPVWQIRSPYGFYPILADLDGQKLSAAVFNTTYKASQVRAMYPSISSQIEDRGEPIDVTQYYDEERIVTIVDEKYRVKDIENKWGFVAIVMIANDSFGEGPWGDGELEWAIPVLEEHNYRESLKSSILEQTIMQPLAIEGGENLPEEIPMGPRDAIPVKIGGKVYRVEPVQVPYQYLQSQTDLLKLFDRVANLPEIMQGQSGSYQTGRAVSTLMGPTQMSFNVKGNDLYPSIATLNKMAMRMWHKMWSRNTHTVFSLGKGSSMSVEKFKTGEFDGWYENIVYVDASSYFDAQSRFMMVLQAVQNRLMSRKTAMQFVPGVTDSPNEEKMIEAELAKDMALQQGAQSFDQANVQPEMGAQGSTNASLSKGYMGKMPPAEPVGGIETPEAPPQEEFSNLLQDMIEFFDQVPIKGRVWLAGNIVTDPSYRAINPDGTKNPAFNGIEVFVEDPNDKAAINTTMRTKFPEVHGSIVYHSGEPSSDEPSVLVHDPDEEEPADDEMAQMFESQAPEAPQGPSDPMAALMGGGPGAGPEGPQMG